MFRVQRTACVKSKKDRSTAGIKDLKAVLERKRCRRKGGEKRDSRPERLDHKALH